MKSKKYVFGLVLMVVWMTLMSCEEFVEVDSPNHKIVTESVFADDATAISAVTGIYNELFNAAFSSGFSSSITVLAGLSSDIFQMRNNTDNRYGPFNLNQISPIETPDATANYNLWSSAYNIIYMTNNILEGLENSTSVSEDTRIILTGKVLFIRAFTYFYLTNLYGDVPLVLSTDYRENSRIERTNIHKVYDRIENDLELALKLLLGLEDYTDSQRTDVNYYVVLAFSARVNLFLENWEKAEKYSTEVIDQVSRYEILEDLEEVFLSNSKEAIWQLSPVGRGNILSHTWDGYIFRGNNSSPFKLSGDFVASLENSDKRLSHWVGYNASKDFFHPHKYKDRNSMNHITEYSMVLRLAEQYLIRAEARAQQGKLLEGVRDLDIIRQRANIELIADTNPGMGKEDLISRIMVERKKELFTEWGHRWLDLKRTNKASVILGPIKPQWQDTDILYPIPGEERMKNPSLSQNNGY